jgi:hypothetical protein
MVDEQILSVLRVIAGADLGHLSASASRYLAGTDGDVTVAARGIAMLMISEGDLPGFEADNVLKSYEHSNHIFADVLGGASQLLKQPLVFWMSKSNHAGCNLIESKEAGCFVIALGTGYRFIDVCEALGTALSRQEVTAGEAWFADAIRAYDADPDSPPFSSLTKGH